MARLEQPEHQPVADLEEEDLAGHVERRAPAEPADVEVAGRVEISSGNGDETGVLLHRPSVPICRAMSRGFSSP